MKPLAALYLLSLLFLSGCAHVISDQSRNLIDASLTFAAMKERPDAHAGKFVMLGGIVAGVRNSKEGGQLEVVQTPLEGNGLPEDAYRSGGRFLAVSAGFVDEAVYRPGRLVTLVGEVKGKKTVPLEGVEYTYPVVAIKEIYAWKYADGDRGYPPLSPWPNYYDDPYYHGYGVTPGTWFERPTGPVFKRWQ